VRIAATGDLHFYSGAPEVWKPIFRKIEHQADVLVVAGDLTNVGLPEEASILVDELADFKLPVIVVLGNHDHEADEVDVIIGMLRDAGVHVLDCTSVQLGDVSFVGTKGFCGGFDRHGVQPFGEHMLKDFIQTTIDEADMLERTASRLKGPCKVAVLHYAPIRTTLKGESEELYPFLGTSRLEEALDPHGVKVIIHGHAHYGSPEGRTRGGAVVYNVTRNVLETYFNQAYRIIEV
jgi:Icc-related predicted phosphoesterase